METATSPAAVMASKPVILSALYKWVAQRPALDWREYGHDPRAAMAARNAEMRGITRDRRDAEAMLRYVARRDSITDDDLREGIRRQGRLIWTEDGNGGGSLDYIIGQFWTVEYRAAACRALSLMLWSRFREDGADTREKIQKAARRELGAPIARRWFS